MTEVEHRRTEQGSRRYAGLDAWPDGDILDALLEGQLAAVAAVRSTLPALAEAAAAAAARLHGGEGRLAYAGAGSSGRLAVQDGVEMTPTFGWPQARLLWLMAGGEGALTRSLEGAEDEAEAGRAAAAGLTPADVLVAVAASGSTPFTCGAQAEARRRGALTIGMANNPGSRLLAEAEVAVPLDSGAEVVAGSTRMKAGTAQKVALNLFSTLLMIRLGHVHNGLMVDMVPANAKLRDRARRMVVELTGAADAAADATLAAAGGHVKTAVLMLRAGLDAGAARALLRAEGGVLRAALSTLEGRPPENATLGTRPLRK